jgi:hypothetical protein
MNLHAKVIATTWQWLAIAWASTSAAGACPGVVFFKFTMNKDRQAAL